MVSPNPHDESYDPAEEPGGIPTWLKALWLAGLAVVLFLGGVTAGMLLERQAPEPEGGLGDGWQDLTRVISYLESDSYYRPTDSDAESAWRHELEARAIDGLLQGSGDKYAVFLPPKEAEESAQQLTGEYEGVGVSIAKNDRGDVEVVSVMVDSPADRADVRVGDVVEVVESTPIPVGDVDLASTLLRGDAGTRVSIRFSRDGDDTYEVTLERERIATGSKTVGYRYFPEQGLGVIQITLFASTTTSELDEALALAKEDGAERLVLDLRGNPGGWVSEARKVIGRFVDPDSGPALLEDTWPAGGQMVELPIDGEGADRFSGPLVVLVDENTASAAEIVASALQYYERATVVGQPTFGKGSVQRVYEFASGESLRLTVAEWFTPEGKPLQDVGVTPDVTIPVAGHVADLIPGMAAVLDGNAHPPGSATPSASPEPSEATPAA
jgi:carboxyl-terminal processing protease